MGSRVMTWEDVYLADKKFPFGAAIALHLIVVVWNPVMMRPNTLLKPPPMMETQGTGPIRTRRVQSPLTHPVCVASCETDHGTRSQTTARPEAFS